MTRAQVMHRPMSMGNNRRSTLLDNLVVYWKLDETSGSRTPVYTDGQSANGYVLTDNNTATSNPGIHGTSAQFTAANQEYLSLTAANIGTLDFSGSSTSFTFNMWLYFDSSATNMGVFGRWNFASNDRCYMMNTTSTTNMAFLVDQTGAGSTIVTASLGAGPTVGAWQMITCMYDHTTGRSYIIRNNGTVNQSSGTITGIFNAGAAFGLASENGLGTGTEFDGRMDSFACWNRRLTAAEITELYNGGLGRDYPFS